MITIRITRELPAPIHTAYAWLTDFQDDDAARTDAVAASRKVLERGEKRVLLQGETRAFGRLIPFVSEIDLAPPDAWVARVVRGPRTGSVTTYKLTPTAGGSRLVVEYRMTHEKAYARAFMMLRKGALVRDLERMWEGYERSMRAELKLP